MANMLTTSRHSHPRKTPLAWIQPKSTIGSTGRAVACSPTARSALTATNTLCSANSAVSSAHRRVAVCNGAKNIEMRGYYSCSRGSRDVRRLSAAISTTVPHATSSKRPLHRPLCNISADGRRIERFSLTRKTRGGRFRSCSRRPATVVGFCHSFMRIPTAALIVLLALPAFSQQKLVESIEVRVANIDVVVRDLAGRPVTGLTKDDCELFEDGVPQTITTLYELRRDASTGAKLLDASGSSE